MWRWVLSGNPSNWQWSTPSILPWLQLKSASNAKKWRFQIRKCTLLKMSSSYHFLPCPKEFRHFPTLLFVEVWLDLCGRCFALMPWLGQTVSAMAMGLVISHCRIGIPAGIKAFGRGRRSKSVQPSAAVGLIWHCWFLPSLAGRKLGGKIMKLPASMLPWNCGSLSAMTDSFCIPQRKKENNEMAVFWFGCG